MVAWQRQGLAVQSSGTFFFANLAKKYQPRYFGTDVIKMGRAMSGDGKFTSITNGTTTTRGAINAQSLSLNLTLVETKV